MRPGVSHWRRQTSASIATTSSSGMPAAVRSPSTTSLAAASMDSCAMPTGMRSRTTGCGRSSSVMIMPPDRVTGCISLPVSETKRTGYLDSLRPRITVLRKANDPCLGMESLMPDLSRQRPIGLLPFALNGNQIQSVQRGVPASEGVRDEIVEGQCAVVGSDICEVSLCSSIRINFGYRNRFHRSGGGRGKGHGNQPGYELGQKRRDEFFRRLLDYQS